LALRFTDGFGGAALPWPAGLRVRLRFAEDRHETRTIED
jgi:hypothetical protein